MIRRIAFLLFCSLALPSLAFAQARDARLLVSVTDPTGAVVPGATVTATGLDDATKAITLAPAKSSDKGVATIEGVLPGRYAIQAEFPGFQLGLLKDVRVRTGDNRHVVVLPLKKMEDAVTVTQDRQVAAADRSTAFGSALTREQVEALSDDPTEMQRQLLDMAGNPDAIIRVDSFEGQQLPPKAQIKAIHITRDAFAAENHGAEGFFIDIITQPGMGPIRANGRFGFWDSKMDGQNPLVAKKGPAQSRNYGGGFGGTLIQGKSSFNINVNGNNSYSTPLLYASTGTTSGTRSENLNLRVPNTGANVNGLFDYAITKDQTLRVNFGRNSFTSGNQGVGQYDLIERAYDTHNQNYNFRIQEAGPLGRRFFINTRLAVSWQDFNQHSTTEAPTIVVTDAFTSGGAQRTGERHSRVFNFASDLDYVRGIHSWRTGVQVDVNRFRTTEFNNYLGTYTFESLTAYEAGTPRSYTRRTGDPNIAYWFVQAGWYLQDDIRVRKNLTLSPGVRIEAQAHLKDYNNISPRFGMTWAPFKSGKTTLRGSVGIFYDWLSANIYQQTLSIDGLHQQQVNINSPAYPDPGVLGGAGPTDVYKLGANLSMARTVRVSAGVQQQVTKKLSIGGNYYYMRGHGLLVGENLNVPVNGVRPDTTRANVIETISAGSSRQHRFNTNVSLNFFTPAAPSKALFDFKRGLSLFVNYSHFRFDNDTDGAFSVPATGSLAAEWGPSGGDVHHRWGFSLNSNFLRNFSASISINGSSAPPITIRTGKDDNADLIFNDRPVGVGRNSERTVGQWYSYAYFSYNLGIGKKKLAMPPGIMINNVGGQMAVSTMAQQDMPRYRIGFNVSIDNLTNHAAYTGFSGVMTSPFFLKPTRIDGVRRVNFNVNLSF